ncbi:Wadjet anti-phage system protein JetD domain-containing protein [Gilvimarinus chinensis]|uniref:Wadjet anti-phage system protein JetD domain-containing protein n=1 Tax=Gilvimarinus chinensis TaxID=396005 RepID=UPI00037ECD4D|nr:Wadjet anti-phage system protein JetD domain-containing protein [Gilvimarinus chinensis]
MTPQPAPTWLEEEPLIQRLLHRLVDKLERGVKPVLKVNRKTAPELYAFDEDVQYLWALVESLDKDYHLITVKKARVKPYQELYEGAQLVFLPEREELVRQWLNRPALDPYALVWQHELERLAEKGFDTQTLSQRMVRLPNLSAEQTLRSLAKIPAELQEPITLRALSARCFNGDSKALDRSEALITELYPRLAHNILPRPLLLTVYVPTDFKSVLLVENQDTFVSLSERRPKDSAIVYSAGFRGSSTRMREPGNVVFSYLASDSSQNSSQALSVFERYWFSAEQQIPVFFWGDLDYAGMSILKAIRQSFTDARAWQPGYQPMLERLLNGDGHTSRVSLQQDPELTGCDFADYSLLPALRRAQAFIDQEIVSTNTLAL